MTRLERPNGWGCKLNPSGTRVLHGNLGVFVTDLRTQVTTLAADMDATWRHAAMGWFNDNQLGISSYGGDPSTPGADSWWRWGSVYDCASGVRTPLVGIAPATAPTITGPNGGRVFGVVPHVGVGTTYYCGGQPWTLPPGVPVAFYGGCDGRYILVGQTLIDSETFTVLGTLPGTVYGKAEILPGPRVGYVRIGTGSVIWSPDGTERVITPATKRAGVGELGAVCQPGPDGQDWDWTFCCADTERPYWVVGRPAGESKGICLEMPGGALDARYVPGVGWTVVGFDAETSKLVAYSGMPADTVRQDVGDLMGAVKPPKPVDPPAKPTIPAPPTEMPALWAGGDNTKGYVPGNCAWSAPEQP